MASSADPYNPKPTLIFKYKTVFSDVISKKKTNINTITNFNGYEVNETITIMYCNLKNM